MPIQIAFTDRFKRANPQAYVRVERGNWQLGTGGFQIHYAVYADKAAADAGGAPIQEGDTFVPFDSSSMTGGIEQYLMAHDAVIAAGSPQQVA